MIYRAKVVQGYAGGSCRAVVPQMYGDTVITITRFSSPTYPTVPTMGWVTFESGDSSFPVWLGPDSSIAAGPVGYGAFSDYTTQTATANTATVMTFNTTDEADGVSIVSGSRITFAHAGTYNLQWSGQFENADIQEHDVSVWLRKNGTDVPGSTGLVAVVSSHGGVAGHVLPSWNFVFTVAANDYYELWWSTTDTNVSIRTYPASTAPVRPSTASLVLTVTPVFR